MKKQAYIIRCAPSRISRLEEMKLNNQIVIGWSQILFDYITMKTITTKKGQKSFKSKPWIGKIIFSSLILLAVIMASGCIDLGEKKPPGEPSENKIPVVDPERVAPHSTDFPADLITEIATSKEGAILEGEGIKLIVPPGAVSENTEVVIKEFKEPPQFPPALEENPSWVIGIGKVYDLGPDGLEFQKPVQVTLTYNEEDLPSGVDEKELQVIYFNGKSWIVVGGLVDTESNTVSIMTNEFPGAVFTIAGIVYGVKLTAATAVAVGAWYYGGGAKAVISQVDRDPIYYENAHEYITPYDLVVQEYTQNIVLGGNSFSNAAELEAILKSSRSNQIRFRDDSILRGPNYEVSEVWGNDWVKPAEYFTSGMKGDCKNIANAYCSVLRAKGINAKCVDGYTDGCRHAWVEVEINGKAYYIGDEGNIWPLDQAVTILRLRRPTGVKGQGYMWDENGQVPYIKDWWLCKKDEDCKESHICKDKKCVKCGGLLEPCCKGEKCNEWHYMCENNKCVKCGDLLEPCCEGEKKCDKLYVCENGRCVVCGLEGQPCCKNERPECVYDILECKDGKCVKKEDSTGDTSGEDTSAGEFDCPIPKGAEHAVTGATDQWLMPDRTNVGPYREWHGVKRTIKFVFGCYTAEGKKQGVWRRWYEDGSPQYKENYKDGKLDGVKKNWYASGKTTEENYKDGKKEGVSKYYEYGILKKSENYKDGKLVWYKYWREDGTISSECIYEENSNVFGFGECKEY